MIQFARLGDSSSRESQPIIRHEVGHINTYHVGGGVDGAAVRFDPPRVLVPVEDLDPYLNRLVTSLLPASADPFAQPA